EPPRLPHRRRGDGSDRRGLAAAGSCDPARYEFWIVGVVLFEPGARAHVRRDLRAHRAVRRRRRSRRDRSARRRLHRPVLGGVRAHFLRLTGHQEMSWRAELYGTTALDHPPAGTFVSKRWRAQVGTLLPAPASIRKTYADGLDAFDAYSKKTFGAPFASASSLEQDLMLEAAGNVVLSNFPLPGGAPDAAKALFPLVVVHTFQATYGLPEYRGQHNDAGVWKSVGWDGDTQPLGNSIYDEHAFGPGKG